MGIYGIDDYLARAKVFVAAGDENSLRHAALELRLCLEHVVYQKLSQIGDKLPPAIFRKWQPPQAMKMLLSFEPNADRDITLTICVENADGTPSGSWKHIGDYKMFPYQWLNKSYHKLGKYLHLPSLEEADAPSKIKATSLQEIIDGIERVSTASMLSTINSITTIACSVCGGDMYVSNLQIENAAVVECYKDTCRAKHNVVKLDEDRFTANRVGFQSVPCYQCGKEFSIEGVTHGEFKDCWNCGQTHIVGWGYATWPTSENDS